jgi:hypothetical protein
MNVASGLLASSSSDVSDMIRAQLRSRVYSACNREAIAVRPGGHPVAAGPLSGFRYHVHVPVHAILRPPPEEIGAIARSEFRKEFLLGPGGRYCACQARDSDARFALQGGHKRPEPESPGAWAGGGLDASVARQPAVSWPRATLGRPGRLRGPSCW